MCYNSEMDRGFNFEVDNIYHIYTRGVDRRIIYGGDPDFLLFQKLLFLCNSTMRFDVRELPIGMSVYDIKREETLVYIGAYAQMPNHIHLLLMEKVPGGISKFMSKTLTSYAKVFNAKMGRTGTLLERPFKAKHVDSDGYLANLYGYIPLNPIKLIDPAWKEKGIQDKRKAKEFLDNYRFSSYLDYMGVERPENKILNRDPFPPEFTKKSSFEHLISEFFSNPQ